MIFINVIVLAAWMVAFGCSPNRQKELPQDNHIAATVAKKEVLYQCPMHPQITAEKSGKCPVCNMDLQLVGTDREVEKVTVPQRRSFKLTEAKQRLIGVVTSKVKLRNLTHEIRASGKVAFDPELFEGSSPSNLWIYAEVFEYEVRNLKTGMKFEAVSPSVPGKVFRGEIASIGPVATSPSRTVRLRGTVANSQGLLRPDAFLNVKISIDMGRRLAIPEDAVLFTGEKSFVYIKKKKGLFVPLLVELGPLAQKYYQVLGGLNEGEEVVSPARSLGLKVNNR